MFFYCYFLDVLIQIVANLIAPYKSDHCQGEQFFQSFQIGHMGVLYIKATAFQSPKEGFDLPALLVIGHRLFGPIERDNDQELHFPVPVDCFAPREIASLPVQFHYFWVVAELAHL